jgi:hypothetical protein
MTNALKHVCALLSACCLGFYLGGYYVRGMVLSNADVLFRQQWMMIVDNALIVALLAGIVAAAVWIGVDYNDTTES